MPIWFSALGIACIGAVFGYMIFYSFKRHQPPMAKAPLPFAEVLALLVSVGAGGTLGKTFTNLEGVNYIGAYGIGLLIGMVANIVLTILYEDPFGIRQKHKKEERTKKEDKQLESGIAQTNSQ